MHRRLNPELFEENTATRSEERQSFSAVASQKMAEEIRELKKIVSRQESQIEVLRGQVGQLSEKSERKMEEFSQGLNSLGQQDRQANLELVQKVRRLERQLQERKVIDSKIETMVDRYNTSLQQFENRLSSMQKVLSDKEMTLMKYNSAVDMLYQEIEKLKKSKS